jgi:hypothetical protein
MEKCDNSATIFAACKVASEEQILWGKALFGYIVPASL